MALTEIIDRKTPSSPSEVVFDPETGLPSQLQEVVIIGHAASGTAASALYNVLSVENSADEEAAVAEVGAVFGSTSEITKAVRAAVKAAAEIGNFPRLKVCALSSTDTAFGSADAALTAVKRVKAEFVVSPYDLHTDTANKTKLLDAITVMNGKERPDNNQFGSFGVGANLNVSTPSSLVAFDTEKLIGIWLRDSGSNPYSLCELAAAAAAAMAANAVPFNPQDSVKIGGVTAPASQADWISVGAGLESESCLQRGWTPLRVKTNGDVAFVRTVCGRITNGISSATVTAYYDVQDFQVIYYWRKTIWTRQNQTDFKNVKASAEKARALKSEMIRLAQLFQDNGMFQAVDKLGAQFAVERSASDRSRFDVYTPINVVPGLHVIATRINATTQFDVFTV